MSTRTRASDDAWGSIIALVIVVTLIGLGIWAAVAAPCSWYDWVPAKDVPNRCLSIDVR